MRGRGAVRIVTPGESEVAKYGLGPVVELEDDWLQFIVEGLGPVDVALAWVDGTPQIVGLRLDPDPRLYTEEEAELLALPGEERRQAWVDQYLAAGHSPVVSSDRLRRLPLAALRMAACGYWVQRSGDHRTSAWEEFALASGNRPGKRLPTDHYQRVADVYKSALRSGEPPLRAVEQAFHVSRPAASQYVKKARLRGLLGYPTRPGVPGADAPTSPIRKRTNAAARAASRRQ